MENPCKHQRKSQKSQGSRRNAGSLLFGTPLGRKAPGLLSCYFMAIAGTTPGSLQAVMKSKWVLLWVPGKKKNPRTVVALGLSLVETTGLEPVTSCV